MTGYYAVFEINELWSIAPVAAWLSDDEGYPVAHVTGHFAGHACPASEADNFQDALHWFGLVRYHWHKLDPESQFMLKTIHKLSDADVQALNLNRQGGAGI